MRAPPAGVGRDRRSVEDSRPATEPRKAPRAAFSRWPGFTAGYRLRRMCRTIVSGFWQKSTLSVRLKDTVKVCRYTRHDAAAYAEHVVIVIITTNGVTKPQYVENVLAGGRVATGSWTVGI